MTLTFDDIRAQLKPRWEHSLPLLSLIATRAQWDEAYRTEVDQWLSGEKSTVHLRDEICLPFKDTPLIIKTGKQFNPTTEWHNQWIPLDTAAHLARQAKETKDIEAEDDTPSSPYFGMF